MKRIFSLISEKEDSEITQVPYVDWVWSKKANGYEGLVPILKYRIHKK